VNFESVLTPSHKVLQNRMNKVGIGDQVKIVYVKEDFAKDLKGIIQQRYMKYL